MAEYKDYGFTESTAAHTFHYLKEPIVEMLNNNTSRCILDLGCGNGYLANFLISKGYDAYGTDASAEGIAIAKKQTLTGFSSRTSQQVNYPTSCKLKNSTPLYQQKLSSTCTILKAL
ncbi:class I SAM-dependent methyltransferase [Mucilaginibacter humi]|uniref:class I SAM-dependent methyltransferase n=1 Tax=Mucilaginibacter humi TaxID=2732510 RepID=UPI001C2E4850|nr:class I SAM-dependent methyltransferase [Mucilaginibacter humi]